MTRAMNASLRKARHSRTRAFGLAAFAATCFVLSTGGCRSEISLATVEGRVTKNGQPLADHWVRFTPVGGGRSGNGRTDGKGHYELAYSYRDKGARVGPNKVQVGTGGQTDSRGNELSLPVEIYSAELTVEDGDNVLDIAIP